MASNINDKIAKLWPKYFPKDSFYLEDPRSKAIVLFIDFFLKEGSEILKQGYNHAIESSLDSSIKKQSVYLSVKELATLLPFPDFLATLKSRPNEIIGSIGIAISTCIDQVQSRNSNTVNNTVATDPIAYIPRFVQVSERTEYSDLKSSIVGQLVKICGYAVKVSSSKRLIEGAEFICSKCRTNVYVIFEDGIFQSPVICTFNKCNNRTWELLRASATVSDYQTIKLQEQNNDDAETSRLPRTFDVEVRGDLINNCIAGDIVYAVGIVKTMQVERNKGNKESAIHQLYVLANSITRIKKSKSSDSSASSHDKRSVDDEPLYPNDRIDSNKISYSDVQLHWIRNIALTKSCFGLLIASLCPTIFGHELVKAGIILSLFGGTNRRKKNNQDGMSSSSSSSSSSSMHVRSDIHVLIVGDPGLGKSQMLRAAAAMAPRAIFVCANTATTAGLTVSVSKEKGKGGDMAIEAGALVLADQGMCCIDELDKMTCDPHSLLEAMEQQSISVAKSGMVTSLRCRTSIIAAANPTGGHYNRGKTVCENLKMAAALLSRFDLVFILLDRPDQSHDRLISEHIMKIHSLSNKQQQATSSSNNSSNLSNLSATAGSNNNDENENITLSQRLRHEANIYTKHTLSMDTFRQYIEYAKQYCSPRLTKPAAKVLQRLYLTMRSQASLGDSLPVTTRNLESLIRLAQARAKIELRDEVTESDANDVVKLLQESLLEAFTTDTGVMDFHNRKGGISKAKSIKALVKVLTREAEIRGSSIFTKYDITDVCVKLKLGSDVDSLIETMRTESYLLLKGPKLFQLNTY